MRISNPLILFCAVFLFSFVRPLHSAALLYQFTGTVAGVNRESPPALVGAPAVMMLSYDTGSYAVRSIHADTDHASVLVSGILGVGGQTVSSFTGIVLCENDHDLGDYLFMESGAGISGILDGDITLYFPMFQQFQPDRRLFAGTQFTGAGVVSGVIFSSPGLPAHTNNEGIGVAWHSIVLIPEPGAPALALGFTAGFLVLRRRRSV